MILETDCKSVTTKEQIRAILAAGSGAEISIEYAREYLPGRHIS